MQQRPSERLASHLFTRLIPVDDVRARRLGWAIAVPLAAMILFLQYLVPPSVNLIFLNLVLAAQSVWFLGAGVGLALSAGTVVAGMVLVHYTGDATLYTVSRAIFLWNLASRLLCVGSVTFVLGGLRQALEVERWRASTDPLTGALNRAAFEERLELTIAQAEAAGQSVVLAFLDLDGFKAVNDQHGHAAGNTVLAAFARAAASSIRQHDLFARIGGDEFAAVLTVASCLEGDRLAELLHRRLSLILSGTGFPVTCSMGALVMDARAMQAEPAVMEQADRLMYVAKQSGKNALHIGRGEQLEEILRAAFPLPTETPPAFAGLLRWADHAHRQHDAAPPRG